MPKTYTEPETGIITLKGEQLPVCVVRSNKRKRTIAFRIGADSRVHVIAPTKATIAAIKKILERRVDWIIRMRKSSCLKPNMPLFCQGAVFPYLGHNCTIKVFYDPEQAASCRLRHRTWNIQIPNNTLSPEGLKHEVRLEITLWMKKRAKTLLRKRIDLLAAVMGTEYKKLIITSPARRWGSCSQDNTIRLNWRLMTLPIKIVDYVIAHELSHVRHKNHSKQYWEFLRKYMPDCQERRKILRKIENTSPIIFS